MNVNFKYTTIANFEIDIDKLASLIIEECPNENEIDFLLQDFGDNIYHYLKKLGFKGNWDSIEDITYDNIWLDCSDPLEKALILILSKNEKL